MSDLESSQSVRDFPTDEPTSGRPIRPSEVTKAKKAEIPPVVFDVFNSAIAAAWDGRSATVLQKIVQSCIASALQISESEVTERGYLNVESIYEEAGWVVVYERPVLHENFAAYFEFSVN